jgi:hypothetical protein
MEKEIDGDIYKLVKTVDGVSFFQQDGGYGSTYVYTQNGENLICEISGGSSRYDESYTQCMFESGK